MTFTRRQFFGTATLAMLGGCARVKQSPIGRMAADFELGGDGKLKVAVIGDFHIVDARSVGIVGRAVNQINNDPDVNFTVVVGDLTSSGTLPQMNLAQQALDRLEKPYFCIPGEQDLNQALEDPYDFYRRVFNKTQWRMSTEGWVFIGLDTCEGNADAPTVSASQLEWLENQLSHTDKKKPLVFLTHHPFNPGIESGRVQNAEDVLALFGNHNLRLVASGHYHGNKVEERDGVLFTTTASCSSVADNDDGTEPKGFRLFTLDGETIQHEFIAVT